MRILMLNANRAGCGTYHRALWFARICAASGRHAVTLCTVSTTHAWRRRTTVQHGVTITEGPAWGYRTLPGYGSNWLDILWRWHAVRRGMFDVVYAFEYHPNVAWPVYLGLQPGQVLLSDWCDWYAGAANVFRGNTWLHAWDRRREDRIRLRAARVSVISSALASRAATLGLSPGRITMLREGVDTRAMYPYNQAAARAQLNIATDALVVVSLYDGHAFPHLVQACAALRRRDQRVHLLLVGRVAARDHACVAAHGLTDGFMATGWCTDAQLPVYLSAGDVCALPLADTLANRARFPHKLGDYLACGRAVITTDVGDYAAMLRTADAAVVASDLTAFTQQLDVLLHDRDRRAYYAERGRAWVAATLDWSVLAPSILAFVEGTPRHHNQEPCNP